MKISIITATFNSSETLGDCIASVNSQTYPAIEHIIIDGRSTDETPELVRSAAKRMPVIVSECDEGTYDAFNKGIRLAGGDIIGFLHSDDTFGSSQAIQHIAEAFLRPANMSSGQYQVDVVYGDLVFVERRNVNKVVRYWVSCPFKPGLLERGWMPPHPTVFMRREVYEKHGLFNTNLKCAADYDYILRVFRDTSLNTCYLPEVITRMRMGGISTKGIRYIINKKLEDYRVLKNNQMPFPLWILLSKNISKIPQLIFRKIFKSF